MKPNRRRPERRTAANVMGRAKATERHVHQFQIACLELERTRRMKELGIASKRVSEINDRLGEIEREMLAHAAAMTPLPNRVAPNVHANVHKPDGATHRQHAGSETPRTERRTLRY